MSFSKSLVSGPAGSIVVSEVGGELKLLASFGAVLGGGEAAGAAKAQASVELDVEGKQIIDLGLEYAMAKFPVAAALIGAAKDAIDAEISKV